MSNPLKLLIGVVVIVSLLAIIIGLNFTEPLPSIKGDYNFEQPDATVKLPEKLREISGIDWWAENQVVGVQDEDGVVFIINLLDGKVIDKQKFRKDGDYEDISVVEDHLFVLRSDGDLFNISDFQTKKQDTDKIETWLTDKYDTEGLCHDARKNRLLVLCKEAGDGNDKGRRDVYGFNLRKNELGKKPVFSIKESAIEEYYHEHYGKSPKGHFKPAALAIHPLTDQIYVVSSALKVLVVLSRSGKLQTVYRLPSKLFRQPEGMTFDPDGNLYISNEGQKGKGRIHRFNYRP